MQRRQHKPTPIVSTRVMLSASKAKAALLAHAARQKALRSEALETGRSVGATGRLDPTPPLSSSAPPRGVVNSSADARKPQHKPSQAQETNPAGSDAVEQQIAVLTATIKDICRRIEAHTSTAVPNTTQRATTETTASTAADSLSLGSVAPQTDDKQEGDECESQQRVPRIICGPIDYEPLVDPPTVFWWE